MPNPFINGIEITPQETSLQRLERLSQLLDSAFPIPGTRFRIGLDSILGFIPRKGMPLARRSLPTLSSRPPASVYRSRHCCVW